MSLLREYTLGDKPVQMELLSDPTEGKAAGFSYANLPLFRYAVLSVYIAFQLSTTRTAISTSQSLFSRFTEITMTHRVLGRSVHIGVSPTAPLFCFVFQEGALCALDMLSVAGLINYIGKVELPLSDVPADGIAVRPVLLRKGNTHLGLYGIGNVKDARMHFELRSNRVRMYMPKDKSEWFNLLLLHQNRYGDLRLLK